MKVTPLTVPTHPGQLKVNFRPLYPDTIDVLAMFAQKYAEPFWLLTFGELEKCSTNDAGLLVTVAKPTWLEEAEASRVEDDDKDENADKSLHCPNASKLNRLLDVAMTIQDIKSGDPEELEVRRLPSLSDLD